MVPKGLRSLCEFLSKLSEVQADRGIRIEPQRWRTQIALGRNLSPKAGFVEMRDTIRELPYVEAEDCIQLREVIDSSGRSWTLRTDYIDGRICALVKLKSKRNGDGHRIFAMEMIH